MKRKITSFIVPALIVFILAGCVTTSEDNRPESTPEVAGSTEAPGAVPQDADTSEVPEDLVVEYFYVQAVLDDERIYANNAIIVCGKHNYKVYETVKVEYKKSGVTRESGTVTISPESILGPLAYDRIINEVVFSRLANPAEGDPVFDKPVIYLYPIVKTEVSVGLDFDGRLTETIPAYNGGWKVTAYPDGTIIDADGTKYPYLFWEGISDTLLSITDGFCVRGSDTKQFLEEILPKIGLVKSEYEEFIEYWLPRMEGNEYNIIQFQGEAYTDMARLNISPAPDSVLRVFMTYRSSDVYVELEGQSFNGFERNGFTVVEWGGSCLG